MDYQHHKRKIRPVFTLGHNQRRDDDKQSIRGQIYDTITVIFCKCNAITKCQMSVLQLYKTYTQT
jgi:hypothetical protein